MAEKKKYYVVLKGRRTGIFMSWSGEGGAEAQVRGVAGAVYRGFATLLEAEFYLKTGGQMMPVPQKDSEKDEPVADYHDELVLGRVVIFTDGASTGNPGPGGYGVVLLYGQQRREFSGGFHCTTNNRMEILACIAGLEALTNPSNVSLYSDSRYVVNSVRLGWANRWRRNGWMRAPDSGGAVARAENVDLWERLLDLLEKHSVTFYWVRGHASHKENERCDQLAVAAAHASNLPEDYGFSGRCS